MKVNYGVHFVFVNEDTTQKGGLDVTLNEGNFDPKKYETLVRRLDGRSVLLRAIKP